MHAAGKSGWLEVLIAESSAAGSAFALSNAQSGRA
jgi:hypothetical protein